MEETAWFHLTTYSKMQEERSEWRWNNVKQKRTKDLENVQACSYCKTLERSFGRESLFGRVRLNNHLIKKKLV